MLAHQQVQELPRPVLDFLRAEPSLCTEAKVADEGSTVGVPFVTHVPFVCLLAPLYDPPLIKFSMLEPLGSKNPNQGGQRMGLIEQDKGPLDIGAETLSSDSCPC